MVETGDVTSAAPTRARATQRPRTIESGGPPPTVMPGLEPGIQAAPPAGYPQTTALDARVKPVHDGTESAASQATQTGPVATPCCRRNPERTWRRSQIHANSSQ